MYDDIKIKQAASGDISKIAHFARAAGGGLFEYFLNHASQTKTQEAVGLLLSVLEEGFCINNALIARLDEEISGGMICYPASEFAGLETYRSFIPDAILAPVEQLFEPLPHNSFYIHSLAVAHGFERKGIASSLIQFAEQAAKAMGLSSVCLHVWADNHSAVSMYNKHGFISKKIIPIDAQISVDKQIPHSGGMLLVSKTLV